MRLAAATLALCLCLAAPAAARELLVVQANVGNVNVPGCQEQVYKLCLRPVEERAAAALRELRVDVVGFEEILPPELCARAPSDNPDNLCSGPLEPPSQVDRLLGAGHARACDSRYGWDCVAVREAAVGLDPGLVTRPVQPACEDDGFTLVTGTLRVGGWPVTAGVAHPSSTDADCRAQQLADFFGSMPAGGPAVILGDFNLDPYREDDASVREWAKHVPDPFKPLSGRELTSYPCGSSQLDSSGRSLDGPVEPCAGPLRSRAIDHVLGRGVSGTCAVRRVDGGGGMDHRAQVCRVELPAEATPRPALRRRGCRLRAAWRPAPPHLRAVRFRIGRRTRVDRSAPYSARLPKGRRVRVTAVPVLVNGDGPPARARPRC